VIEVPDDRLPILAKIVSTQKIVPAVVEFYDIAGLVKGASTGEGLGNKFLSHIREVAAIAHVVRLFEDGNIIHVQDTVDALRDIQTVETELIFADLATLFKQKEPKGKFSKEEGIRYDAIIKLKNHLNAGSSARTLRLTDDEAIQAKDLQLLTMKPEIFVFNVSLKTTYHVELCASSISPSIISPILYIYAFISLWVPEPVNDGTGLK